MPNTAVRVQGMVGQKRPGAGVRRTAVHLELREPELGTPNLVYDDLLLTYIHDDRSELFLLMTPEDMERLGRYLLEAAVDAQAVVASGDSF